MTDTSHGEKHIESSVVSAQAEWEMTERMMVGDFNPFHDPKDGRFTTGESGVAYSPSEGFKSMSHEKAIAMADSMGCPPEGKYMYGANGYFCSPRSFRLNEKLRKGEELDPVEQDIVTVMDKCMKPLPEGIQVFRAMNSKDLFKALRTSGLIYRSATGKVLKNKGYLSTSFDTTQNRFLNRDVHMIINAPKGSKAFISPARADDVPFIAQSEIAFARDSGLRIKNIRKEKVGGKTLYIVEADLIQGRRE